MIASNPSNLAILTLAPCSIFFLAFALYSCSPIFILPFLVFTFTASMTKASLPIKFLVLISAGAASKTARIINWEIIVTGIGTAIKK